MKIFLSTILFSMLILIMLNSALAKFQEMPTVAVMDFGKLSNAAGGVNTDNVGLAVSEYIIQALLESGKFKVMAKDHLEDVLAEHGLDTTGIIPPSKARQIGKILGVRYIIYGNVNDVNSDTFTLEIISNGADVHTVKALIIARMMDVETGEIVTAARGEGKSDSSKVKISIPNIAYLLIGTARVSQVSVHNAIKKAAYSMVDLLIKRLEDY
ncbi:MAG: hypothetical protein IKZ58_05440 [Selenomonadaceae bacterium]|nr:hypothetical protein [Selenomonadaceae bacterium]